MLYNLRTCGLILHSVMRFEAAYRNARMKQRQSSEEYGRLIQPSVTEAEKIMYPVVNLSAW